MWGMPALSRVIVTLPPEAPPEAPAVAVGGIDAASDGTDRAANTAVSSSAAAITPVPVHLPLIPRG